MNGFHCIENDFHKYSEPVYVGRRIKPVYVPADQILDRFVIFFHDFSFYIHNTSKQWFTGIALTFISIFGRYKHHLPVINMPNLNLVIIFAAGILEELIIGGSYYDKYASEIYGS